MAIAMIGVPSEGPVPAANQTSDVEAVLPSSSAIEVNLHGDVAPPSEAPAPTAAAAPAEATAEVAPAPAPEPAKPEERKEEAPRHAVKEGAPRSAAQASLPQAALAPSGRRSPLASLGFFLALVLFAIAYLAWRWMHHHSSFHLPMQ
jgi:cell division protein FtsN